MKKKILAGLAASVVLLFGTSAVADSVLHIWECDLNEGMTNADAVTASAAWLAAAKKVPSGEELEVYVDFPIAAAAGDGRFNFVMAVADEATWGAWYGAEAADSGMADANAAWSEVASCSSSSMWYSVEIE
jgi:hypothetical protein